MLLTTFITLPWSKWRETQNKELQ